MNKKFFRQIDQDVRRSATKPSGPADHRFPGPEASGQKPPDHTDLGPELHAGQGLKSRNQQHLDSGAKFYLLVPMFCQW